MSQSSLGVPASYSQPCRARSLQNLAWGLALATSWTWCIGMFLPIILMRLFGWPGVAAFVIPNVLGCALFGFTRSREESEREVAQHRPMLAVFSAVTIAYQVFFVGWILGPFVVGGIAGRAGVSILAGACMLLLGSLRLRWIVATAVVVYLGSVTVLLTLPLSELPALPAHGELADGALLALIPTLVFGFMLCPSLDLTFHRARQLAPNTGAFTIFGVAFAVMLVLTLCYGSIAGALSSPAVLFLHITPQLIVTGAMHARELRAIETPQLRSWMLIPLAVLVGAAIAAFAPSEASYLRILGAYGLLFPAYVLIAMRGQSQSPTRATLWWVFLSVGISIPFLEFGFIHQQMYLLPIGIVLPTIAFLLARRAGAGNPTISG